MKQRWKSTTGRLPDNDFISDVRCVVNRVEWTSSDSSFTRCTSNFFIKIDFTNSFINKKKLINRKIRWICNDASDEKCSNIMNKKSLFTWSIKYVHIHRAHRYIHHAGIFMTVHRYILYMYLLAGFIIRYNLYLLLSAFKNFRICIDREYKHGLVLCMFAVIRV